MEDRDMPCYFIDSDEASRKAQNLYKGITWFALSLMFLSTILVSLSTQLLSWLPNAEKVNAIILFFSGTASVWLVFAKPEKKWYLGRAIAESMKTLSWRYMMHAEPFAAGVAKTDLEAFIDRIKSINKQGNRDGFIPKPNKKQMEVITPKMVEVHNMSFEERKKLYAEERIVDQINWYGSNSEQNGLKARIGSGLIIGFQFAAFIYVLLFFELAKTVNLNNIFVFLATSIIGVVEMNKHKELFQSYALTKQELNIIKSKLAVVTTDDELKQFVLEAEQAISREHIMWLARRGAQDD